jgi:hypothetical protein
MALGPQNHRTGPDEPITKQEELVALVSLLADGLTGEL